MRVHTLKLALIIAIINSANAWWDSDQLLSIPNEFRSRNEFDKAGKVASDRKDIKQTINDGLLALEKLKIDLNSLKDYIPLLDQFDRMLDDCIGSEVPEPPEKDNNDMLPEKDSNDKLPEKDSNEKLPEDDSNDYPPIKIIPPEEFSPEDSPHYYFYDDHNDFVYGEMYQL